MSTKTSRYKPGGLDKYYTKPDIARDLSTLLAGFLVAHDLQSSFERIIEPSAGAGAFLEPMRAFGAPITAIDIEPDHPSVQNTDFFDFRNSERALLVGNPPFGHASHLAVKFFNHAAENGAQIIAFVLPRTFRKRSVQNRLNSSLHLAREYEVPARAFLLGGQEHDVPCIFQIWIRSNELRSIRTVQSSAWIEFTRPEDADHAMRRVGRRAGDILCGTDHSRSTTHFFKVTHPAVLEVLRENDEIKELSQCTAGAHSISKSEIREIVDREMARKPTLRVA